MNFYKFLVQCIADVARDDNRGAPKAADNGEGRSVLLGLSLSRPCMALKL